jgi:hypothetical protein
MIIKNFPQLAITKERKITLEIVNFGLEDLDYDKSLKENFKF